MCVCVCVCVCYRMAELAGLVQRLEVAVTRLEAVSGPAGGGAGGAGGAGGMNSSPL